MKIEKTQNEPRIFLEYLNKLWNSFMNFGNFMKLKEVKMKRNKGAGYPRFPDCNMTFKINQPNFRRNTEEKVSTFMIFGVSRTFLY